MNLLRSFCCVFGGRCAEEEPKPRETMRREAPGNLGQKEAERGKASEDELRRRVARARPVASVGCS
jgi:hypothetical protein